MMTDYTTVIAMHGSATRLHRHTGHSLFGPALQAHPDGSVLRRAIASPRPFDLKRAGVLMRASAFRCPFVCAIAPTAGILIGQPPERRRRASSRASGRGRRLGCGSSTCRMP
ncbi:unnamed protein product [Prorocentrum cordatum]|uniref:Uncharacterized protein n=1 Tax=Prorocentrum cordatum TaxID=2364126 RepID=A0ABN9R2L3_9DINO|nr:unnamed protein product [Polarella glacialis]